MLKEAALLQLQLLQEALDEELSLKDATPYNVQWRGAEPVFVDVGSFERLRPGEPWAGYRQFCMQLLYPLMLQAYAGVAFQPWLRGNLEGIAPADAARLLRAHRRRRGVFMHAAMHARLERRYAHRGGEVKRELRSAGFGKELIRANARRLERLVRRLEWSPGASAWSDYGETHSYSERDAEAKAAFVREAAGAREWRLAWDIGCNEGRYSRVVADAGARYVVAMDADHAVADHLFRELRDEGRRDVLPLVVDVADPSPALGWRNEERPVLAERGTPELTLALALVHHLAITRNVPLAEIVGWLRSLGTALVIEFVEPDDPMAKRLLAPKREGLHDDYRRDVFERQLADGFQVERTEELSSGTRVLYFARPRR